jgi:hypothetical protein
MINQKNKKLFKRGLDGYKADTKSGSLGADA